MRARAVCGRCMYTISTFYWRCVICQSHVSTGCLCRALVSASCVLPAGLLARWVSDCVAGARRAPSVLCEGPLMGPKPQRSEFIEAGAQGRWTAS